MNTPYKLIEQESVHILSINSLLDEWQNGQLLKELDHKINKGAKYFILDLAPLKFVNATGLNFILSLFSKTRNKNGHLILANASQHVQKLLELTKLTAVFTVKNSVATAAESFSVLAV